MNWALLCVALMWCGDALKCGNQDIILRIYDNNFHENAMILKLAYGKVKVPHSALPKKFMSVRKNVLWLSFVLCNIYRHTKWSFILTARIWNSHANGCDIFSSKFEWDTKTQRTLTARNRTGASANPTADSLLALCLPSVTSRARQSARVNREMRKKIDSDSNNLIVVSAFKWLRINLCIIFRSTRYSHLYRHNTHTCQSRSIVSGSKTQSLLGGRADDTEHGSQIEWLLNEWLPNKLCANVRLQSSLWTHEVSLMKLQIVDTAANGDFIV